MWIPIDPDEPFSNSIYDQYKVFIKPRRPEMSLKREDLSFAEKVFYQYDYDHDGYLSRGEFKDVLKDHLKLHIKVPEFKDDPAAFEQFNKTAFDAHDDHNIDKMTLQDFLLLWQSVQEKYPDAVPKLYRPKREQQETKSKASLMAAASNREFEMMNLDEKAMRRIFRLFDKDASGYLDVQEIKMIVGEMGIPDYERDGYDGFIKRNCRAVDEDDSGEIEFEEFKTLLQSLVTCKVDRNYRQWILNQGKKRGSGFGPAPTGPLAVK